eukprot:65839-Chlamydomonas_euryale.AAC.2
MHSRRGRHAHVSGVFSLDGFVKSPDHRVALVTGGDGLMERAGRWAKAGAGSVGKSGCWVGGQKWVLGRWAKAGSGSVGKSGSC